jgi:hypothetical protein
VPKNIKEAMQIDRENGNTLWMNAVRLEMNNAIVAFEEYDEDPYTLVGYTQIMGHLPVKHKHIPGLGKRFCLNSRLPNIQSNTEQLTLPPVKKKKEQKKRKATESNSTDQTSAQYNPPRAPDGCSP